MASERQLEIFGIGAEGCSLARARPGDVLVVGFADREKPLGLVKVDGEHSALEGWQVIAPESPEDEDRKEEPLVVTLMPREDNPSGAHFRTSRVTIRPNDVLGAVNGTNVIHELGVVQDATLHSPSESSQPETESA